MSSIQIVECPRDAMQSWPNFIETPKKIEFVASLLQCGFNTLDCLSFVSAKAIPQLADSHQVIQAIEDTEPTNTKILAIVLNERGAKDAAAYKRIDYLGYPFSISATFQLKNGNSTIADSLLRLQNILNIASQHNKELVVYISMAFGNPYGDDYNVDKVLNWMHVLQKIGVKHFSLADTVGLAIPEEVADLVTMATKEIQADSIGVHLHSTPYNLPQKLAAAHHAGCVRFDGALGGFGGCPMAGNSLVGNMDTQLMLQYFDNLNLHTGVNKEKLAEAEAISKTIFI